jgi:hypothetical protein
MTEAMVQIPGNARQLLLFLLRDRFVSRMPGNVRVITGHESIPVTVSGKKLLLRFISEIFSYFFNQ